MPAKSVVFLFSSENHKAHLDMSYDFTLIIVF